MVKLTKKGLVVVESPTKVKKISAFLGNNYTVMASMGHVRDLPNSASEIPEQYKKLSWSTLGVNVEEAFTPLYIVQSSKKKIVKELKDALLEVEELIIATDEDREGESIGWHLVELLKPKVPVRRIVFSEITEQAIQAAIQSGREVDKNLVAAQETRRILDRLYGYTLSPLLWKKIARGLSAGRVQSVATRIIVQRERERMAFRSGTYWDLKAQMESSPKDHFPAQLIKLGQKRVATGKDFDENTGKLKPDADVVLLSSDEAQKLRTRLLAAAWRVASLEEKQQVRKPYPPFTTSSLQQEANRKLNLSAKETMSVAQRLYENGYITYMRTDSVNLSDEAIHASRQRVGEQYGKEYLSPSPRQFATKSKMAQEAHEAIRPAGTQMKTAQELQLTGLEAKLYSMIWQRTMATQMADAILRFQTATIVVEEAEFRATGRKIEFAGFFRAYVEGSDDPEAALEDQEVTLPPLKENQSLTCRELEALGHETKPPARYTEASLIKTLEEKGIGRPSTYASIISTIQDRGYIRKAGNQLIPTFVAMAVVRLLEEHFTQLVDLDFTAKMEEHLDDIAGGGAEALPYLKSFYLGNQGLAGQVKQKEEGIDARTACTLQLEGIDSDIRVGRYGPYFEKEIGDGKVTVSIPDNVAPSDLSNEMAQQLIEQKQRGPQSIGIHSETNLPIFALTGPFGPYLQLGETGEDGAKPKRVSLPKNLAPDQVDLQTAMALLSLPRRVGLHPEDGKVVNAGIGRFGPYVQHDGKYKSLGKDDNVLTIDLQAAVELLKLAKTRATATPLRELGAHPEDGKPVGIYDGRYGPYVKHGKINATLPKDSDLNAVTLEQAVELLTAKAQKKPARKKFSRKKTSFS